MMTDPSAVVRLVRAGGFGDGARGSGVSASGRREALRRFDVKFGRPSQPGRGAGFSA